MSDNGNDTPLLTSPLVSPGTNCCPCRHFVFLVTDIRHRDQINGTYLFLTTLTKGSGTQWHFSWCWNHRSWTEWRSHSVCLACDWLQIWRKHFVVHQSRGRQPTTRMLVSSIIRVTIKFPDNCSEFSVWLPAETRAHYRIIIKTPNIESKNNLETVFTVST